MHRNTSDRSTRPSAIERLLRLAGRQHGVFCWAQAAELAVTRGQLRALIERGVIVRRRRGLYLVVGSANTYERRTMEAVLAAPAGSAVSHLSAAYFLDRRPAPSLVDLTMRRDERIRIGGVVGHRSVLPSSHVAMVGAVPVTTVARTVVDLASLGDPEVLTSFLDPVLVDGRTNPARILRTLDEIVQRPGRHGTQLLRSALAAWTDPVRPGSPAEARLLRRLHEMGFGGFVTQHEVRVGDRSRFIDVAWPDDLAGLEYAGKLAHSPRHWTSDEARAAELASIGWRLREVDAPDLTPGSRAMFGWLEAHLGRR